MDVHGHTTTLRDRTRVTSSATEDETTTGGTEYISLPGIGLVQRKHALYGGGALALVLVLALVGGNRGGYRFNFDSGL